jgi:cephalosporin-C deacetylase-like acetyl esterase
MTPDWERPVGAVLDYFGVERCTILGFSLGGYLAPRAAAFESRIKRVIANDVLYDFLAVFAKRSGAQVLDRLEKILDTGDVHQAGLALEQAAQGGEVARWTVEHAKEVSGFQTGFEVLTWLRQIHTQPFAERIEQDFLLLGAQEDHIVPIEQFYRQIESLTKVRSLTAQLFTRADHAHTHCHVSNTALVVDFIVSWINFQLRAEAGRTHLLLI